MKPATYRGFTLTRCAYGSWAVTFPTSGPRGAATRTRFGTLAEIRADVDAYLAGSLPPLKRGGA